MPKGTNVDVRPIIDQLRTLVSAMEIGDYTEADMLCVITRCKETGLLTISSTTEHAIDDKHELFREMAKLMG